MTEMKCLECVFWKPAPQVVPEAWGRCRRLSADDGVPMVRDGEGKGIPVVTTPPHFGCTLAEASVQTLEAIQVYCGICGETVEHEIDAGMPQEAEEVAQNHLRGHREGQAKGLE